MTTHKHPISREDMIKWLVNVDIVPTGTHTRRMVKAICQELAPDPKHEWNERTSTTAFVEALRLAEETLRIALEEKQYAYGPFQTAYNTVKYALSDYERVIK